MFKRRPKDRKVRLTAKEQDIIRVLREQKAKMGYDEARDYEALCLIAVKASNVGRDGSRSAVVTASIATSLFESDRPLPRYALARELRRRHELCAEDMAEDVEVAAKAGGITVDGDFQVTNGLSREEQEVLAEARLAGAEGGMH